MPKGGTGGKSGLHGHTVPDNVRRGQPHGKCHRKHTATSRKGDARVKRCGKSAPRFRQRKRHGKPHREQDRIGTARARPRESGEEIPDRVSAVRRPGRLLEVLRKPHPRGMAVTRRFAAPPYRTRLTGRLIRLRGLGGTTAGPPPIRGDEQAARHRWLQQTIARTIIAHSRHGRDDLCSVH